MTAIRAAYRNERDKVLFRKKYIVFLIIGIIISVVLTMLGTLATGIFARWSGFTINLAPSPTGILPLFSHMIIPLLIFMASADLFTAESADRTMKAMICRPIARWKLYSAKLLAIVTYAVVYLACILVVSTVFNLFTGRVLSVGEFFTTLISYALTVFPLTVLAAFAIFVALFGRSSTLTMFLLVIIYLALNVLTFIFPVLFNMLFTSYLSWHRMWVGALPGASRLIHALAIVGGYGVAFFMAGSLIFDKKEY
ncbi:MAG: ABC transporter permease [Defluviitaleaceae bacterium]|nr:ABC transporter permease [Defluviitaleaceae bacterium]